MQASRRRIFRRLWALLSASVFGLALFFASPVQCQVLGASPETAPPVRSSQGAAPLVLLTMARDHSLFFPAYNDLNDLTGDGVIDYRFNPNFEYLGLYNSYYCYSYTGSNSNLAAGNSAYFNPTALAQAASVNGTTVPGPCVASGQSSTTWSGNWLNYVTTSRIDAMRVALYGGYREVDLDATSSEPRTILRRAYIPQDGHAWAKEYTSVANDGYDIRLYTPLGIPLVTNGIQRRHFFGNLTSPITKGATFRTTDSVNGVGGVYTHNGSGYFAGLYVPTTVGTTTATLSATDWLNCATLNNCSNYPPLLRIIKNSATSVWRWASSERPVLNAIATPINYAGYVTGYGNIGDAKGVEANAKLMDNDLTLTDYTVRVQACATGTTNFVSGCKAYTDGSGNITYKPVGVLHDYGENGSLNFGLITGSYDKNLSGGRLRKNMGSFVNEVSTTSGKFLNPTNSLISQINNIRIRNFNNPSNPITVNGTIYQRPVPDYTNDYYGNNFVYKNQWDEGSSTMLEGTYADWGNPVAEMMYEGLRYFAGKTTATTAFGGTSTEDTAVDLQSPGWSDPYADTSKWCAKPNLLVVSGANPSFDSDQLPGSTFIATGFSDTFNNAAGTSLNVTTLADSIGSIEGINGTSRFIGESYTNSNTLNADDSPTLKNISSLGKIRGLIPDETGSQGSYYAAAVAYFGKQASLRTVNNKNIPTVDTYALLLNSPFPTIKVPFPGGKTVTIVPFAKTVFQAGGHSYNSIAIGPAKGAFQPSNQIVGAYVTYLKNPTNDPTHPDGNFSMKFYVNYEDHAWGGDFEMDSFALYEINATSTDLTITISPTYQAGGAQQNIGYEITGTTADGPYLVVQDQVADVESPANASSSYYLNVPADRTPNYCDTSPPPNGCNPLPNTGGKGGAAGFSSVRFTPAANPSENTLKNPLWYAARWGGYADGATPTTAFPTRQDPDHYTQVTSPGRLKTAFANMFQSVLDNSATLGTVTSSSQQLQTTAQIFTTSYNAKTFYGELTATNFTVTAGAQSDAISYADIWTANAKLPSYSTRNIFYKNPSDGTANRFIYSNINRDYPNKFTSSDAVDYLRGNSQQEVKNNGTLRNRVTTLGTALNSVPLYSQDTGMVYLGANDGMLHAFDASTGTSADGTEKFAYIPSTLILTNAGNNDTSSALNLLSKTTFSGRFYVDGNTAISDKYKADSYMKDAAPGYNYLVGFLGRGGKGLFALPVNTAGIKTDGGVWENFGNNDNNMGYLLGNPIIEQLADGTNVVIFGNGYNSASQQAALYVLRLVDGVVLAKYLTCTGGIQNSPSSCVSNFSSSANGLATPGVVRSNGVVQYAYAGDYLGNVWKFDLTGLAYGSSFTGAYSNNNSDYAGTKILKLFTAVDSQNNIQHIVTPITTAYSSDSTDPVVANKRFIFFGTGSDLTSGASDIGRTTAQTIYGIIDNLNTTTTPAISNTRGSSLQGRTIDASGTYSGFKVNSTVNVRSFSQWVSSPNDMVGKVGWYMDLTTANGSAAEQVFTAANLRPATTPTLTVSSSIVNNTSCTTTGAGYLSAMDAYHGGGLSSSYFDINRNGNTTDETFTSSGVSKTVGSIDFGVGTIGQAGYTGDNVVVQGSGVNTSKTSDNTADVGTKKFTKVSRRISWREIVK